MELIDTIGGIAVYEHKSGKAVVIAKVKGRGNNGAIFPTVSEALSCALALAWGGSVRLTHRFKTPVTTN